MKTYLLVAIIAICFSCANKKPKQDAVVESPGITDIQFDEKMHDFGNLVAGETVVYTFVFTNVGENNFVIKSAESDCGCVQVQYSKEPVKPNEKGEIEVEFDSSGIFGRQLKTIEIQSNCKEPKQLVIFAEVKNELLEINS